MSYLKIFFRHIIKNFFIIFYIYGVFVSRIVYKNRTPELDLVCVIPDNGKGWILEKIATVITRQFKGKSIIYGSLYRIPDSKYYLFLHYEWLFKALKFNPKLLSRKVFVWYTHPKEILVSNLEMRYVYKNHAKAIVVCKKFSKELMNDALPDRVFSIIGAGADPIFFKYHKRKGNVVGLCGAFYQRKRPDLMLEIIKYMPHVYFILIGKGWEEYCNYQNLIELDNFEYIETKYENYPEYFHKMNIFLSVSELEGGPVPLLEAMMANVIPVVSDTGFAKELIEHGHNGYIFSITAKKNEIANFIEVAFNNKQDVRSTVEHLTWDYLGDKISSIMKDN